MELPKGFIEEISRYPELAILKYSLLTEPEVSIRFNPKKIAIPHYPDVSRVPWCKEGVYLNERPHFTFDPSLHQGCYYVQDASSMAITAVLRELVTSPIRYLDACAAPGGKTTAALSVLPEESVVVANEFDYKRADILTENIAKWGYPNVVVSRGDTSRIRKLRSEFDIIAVDAPCSGEGMMRKDTHAVEQWSEALVRQCAAVQREILSNVWDALSPGGYLIYSTCTFNRIENEENLRWLIDGYGATPMKINSLESLPMVMSGIDCEYPCYRFIPGIVRGEGLFLAVLRKDNHSSVSHEKKRLALKSASNLQIENWFSEEVELCEIGDEIFALPKKHSAFMKSLLSKLDVVYAGVRTAKRKGKDIIPANELALSILMDKTKFVSYDLNYEEAICYLKRDTLSLTSHISKGIVLLNYNDRPLGFVKNLGSRANNLLPKPWGIKSSIKDPTKAIKLL